MRLIPLTQGYAALVSDKDYSRVAQFNWQVEIKEKPYAGRNVRKEDGRKTRQALHCFILGINDPATEIDHRDGNGLNCQRGNLRRCNRQQNGSSLRLSKRNTSGFKGVYWHKRAQKWMAYINPNRLRIHLGLFTDKIEAAKAYNTAARKYFGKFAKLNEVTT